MPLNVSPMAPTVTCPQCRMTLNLPPGAEGRRLKCPQCGTKFAAPGTKAGVPGPRPPSGVGFADAGLSSEAELPRSPSRTDIPRPPSKASIPRPPSQANLPRTPGRAEPSRKPGDADLPLPTAEGDLRETFDLPLMMEAAEAPAPPRKRTDAESLFDDAKPAPRRPTGAEARAKPRRCPTCGGFVPAGMSLCNACGLDLDTGIRVPLDDELEAAPARRGSDLPPFGVLIIGGVCLLASLLLAAVSFHQWQARRVEGAEFLGLVCLFATFASVQFLRGKSIKLLIVALALGAVIDVIGLVVLPVIKANAETVVEQPTSVEGEPEVDVVFKPVHERLDLQAITWGIALLLSDAAIMAGLATPGFKRYYDRR